MSSKLCQQLGYIINKFSFSIKLTMFSIIITKIIKIYVLLAMLIIGHLSEWFNYNEGINTRLKYSAPSEALLDLAP